MNSAYQLELIIRFKENKLKSKNSGLGVSRINIVFIKFKHKAMFKFAKKVEEILNQKMLEMQENDLNILKVNLSQISIIYLVKAGTPEAAQRENEERNILMKIYAKDNITGFYLCRR